MSMSENSVIPVLYHVLNDDGCAEVRRFIVSHQLTDRIQFRNIDRSEAASSDLLKLQGDLHVPVLVCGSEVVRGASAIVQHLRSISF